MAVKNVVQFVFEVRGELAKVVWPKFDSWVESTVVVLVLVVAFAIYLGLIDFGLLQLVQFIIKRYG